MQRQRLLLLLVVSFILASGLSNCKSTSKSTVEKHTGTSSKTNKTGNCEQTIIYHVDKVTGGDHESPANIDITVNPSAKLITLAGEIPSTEQKFNFETVVETIDCNLNTDLTQGYSIYKGYIKQEDGSTTQTSLMIEARDGRITMHGAESNGEMVIWVSSWKVSN